MKSPIILSNVIEVTPGLKILATSARVLLTSNALCRINSISSLLFRIIILQISLLTSLNKNPVSEATGFQKIQFIILHLHGGGSLPALYTATLHQSIVLAHQ